MGDYDIISDKLYVTDIQGIFENNNSYQNLSSLVSSLADKTDNEESKKGEENKMILNQGEKILKIYKERKIKKFTEEQSAKRKDIIDNDSFNKILKKAEEDIKDLYIKEYGENDMPKANWITIYSKETDKALEILDKEAKQFFIKLDNLLEEIRAQLELFTLPEDKVKVLTNYEILVDGKINA